MKDKVNPLEFKYVLNQHRIDRIEEINLQTVSFEDIYSHYGTGVAIKRTSERQKDTYRHGIGTNIGDIELSVWRAVVRHIVKRTGEQQLFDSLYEYEKKHNPYLLYHNSNSEFEQHVLELYARRIFDDPKWVNYEDFNRNYRPKELAEPQAQVRNEVKNRDER